jgi:hypothetical protein
VFVCLLYGVRECLCVCCTELESGSRHEHFIMLLSFQYLILYFASHRYLDSVLSVFIILQCLKADLNGRKYSY